MNDLEAYLLDKAAEVSGTQLAPISPPVGRDRDRSNPAKTIKTSHVDTTGKEPPQTIVKKEAQYYALPSHQRYPLDSYSHVKEASAYYGEFKSVMAPEVRREYCHNLYKRASMLGINVDAEIQKYGSDSYATEPEFDVAMISRRTLLKEAAHNRALDALIEHKGLMEPDDFAAALGEFDKVAGIDMFYGDTVLDPYFSTFGVKVAEDDDAGATIVGNDYLSNKDLKDFAKVHADCLKDVFGEDFAKEFRKEPVSIFKSLPVDQKKLVMRRVNSYISDPTTT